MCVAFLQVIGGPFLCIPSILLRSICLHPQSSRRFREPFPLQPVQSRVEGAYGWKLYRTLADIRTFWVSNFAPNVENTFPNRSCSAMHSEWLSVCQQLQEPDWLDSTGISVIKNEREKKLVESVLKYKHNDINVEFSHRGGEEKLIKKRKGGESERREEKWFFSFSCNPHQFTQWCGKHMIRRRTLIKPASAEFCVRNETSNFNKWKSEKITKRNVT